MNEVNPVFYFVRNVNFLREIHIYNKSLIMFFMSQLTLHNPSVINLFISKQQMTRWPKFNLISSVIEKHEYNKKKNSHHHRTFLGNLWSSYALCRCNGAVIKLRWWVAISLNKIKRKNKLTLQSSNHLQTTPYGKE